MPDPVSLSATAALPRWRRPTPLLFLMAAAMPLSFATWSALLNNFVVEVASFDGADIGLLHTVREIPGLLAVAVIALLLMLREQVLAVLMLALLGAATMLTAQFPTMAGLLMLTLLSSIGFHYFETVNQSLQLQWLEKDRAPQVMGWLMAAGSAATLLAYGLIVVLWEPLGLTYNLVFMVAGGSTIAAALAAHLLWPQFENPVRQRTRIVLRRRYWLYYALQFMAGARRQIFVVFGGFMLVERYGMDVRAVTLLFMINLVANIVIAPVFGRVIAKAGERLALVLEYLGLTGVFVLYAALYWFEWGVAVACLLYVVDNLFFALAIAMRTYFQKIADPADIAPTQAVSFTINHIAAVFLPFGMGLIWLVSPALVFLLGAGMAAATVGLALLVPRRPEPGHETVFALKPRFAGRAPVPHISAE